MSKIAAAKARLASTIKDAERRYMDEVAPFASPDDDFHLTRWALVRRLRAEGLKFREIGERFGFTANQARVLFMNSERYF